MKLKLLLCLILLHPVLGCDSDTSIVENNNQVVDDPDDENDEVITTYADIDFSNWKVTLPVDEDNNGKPDEYQPDDLVDYGYQTLEAVQPFMYDDEEDSSIVFYTYPGVSTTNSSYSRTELRELINPSNSKDNWTLLEGGEMTCTLKVESISENNSSSSEDYHRVIVMQIHGIISQEDMDTYNFDGNNGPPLIKIYWKDGYIWCHKKSLVDESTDGFDLYGVYDGTWSDIKVNLGYVGYEIFDFRITASNARIEVQLNDNDPYIYQDISLVKWPFENYFKAGNYLASIDETAFSYVKYYDLNINH